MGGGEPTAPLAPATPPSTGETSAQAIQAQIDALPKILAAQQQYGGQFSQLNLEQLKQYAPQYAQVGLDIQKMVSPEITAAQKTLTDYLNQTDQAEYDALKPGLLEDVRAAQSQRGIGAISPIGSIDESVQLQRLKQSLKDRRLNVSLSTAGRVPVSQIPTTSGTGQLVQNVNPDSIFNYQQGLNNFAADIYRSQNYAYGQQTSNAGNIFGTVLGDVAGDVGKSWLGKIGGKIFGTS